MILKILTKKIFWIALFIPLTLFYLITTTSYAQTPGSSNQTLNTASGYGITFPIAALGNCTDINSCKTFCDDPINKDTCIAFAKNKGFYKEDALTTQKDTVLAKAKTVLGCDSETSCLNFCAVPTNQDKCSSFAQSSNLQGGIITRPDNQNIINQAKEVLGCSSEADCKTFCGQDANKTKCADFANQVGLRGGEQKIGPGGCTSEETCKTFCSNPNNFQICAGFTQSEGGNFSGPGGCNSPQSCQTYCQQNPQSCPNFSSSNQNSQNGFGPAETCNRTPNCSWNGSSCFCGNPSIQSGTENASVACVRYGCVWTSNSCQCQNIGSNYNLDAAKQGCEAGKGTWTGSYCQMSLGNSPYSGGASFDQQQAVCQAGGGTCGSGSTSTFCNCQGYKAPSSGSNNSGSYSCQPPSSGCGTNSYYDYSRCGCYQNNASTTNGSGGPSGSGYNYSCANVTCGSGYAPDPGNHCACIPTPSGNYNNGSGSPGNTMSYSQQESMCTSGGGTCGSGSTSTFCNCQGYKAPSSGSNNSGSYSCQPPSSGCGTNSYYDYSRCGCYQNGSTPTTPPTSGSCPAGQYWNGSGCLNSNTAPQNSTTPSFTSQPTPAQTNTPQPSPAVKGISTGSNIWTWITNLFSK